MIEPVDRRILGAFVCVDAITGASVASPIHVTSSQLTVKPNRSGIYVIFDAPGFHAQTTQFLPATPWPAPASFEVTLQDPGGRYLPRKANVNAPLALPAPGAAFAPQPVKLFPAPSAPVGPNWAVVHVSVTAAGAVPAKGLPWAILQFTRSDKPGVTTACQADANGEALLAVPGIPVSIVQKSSAATGGTTGGTASSGAGTGSSSLVSLSTITVTVTAFFNAVPIPPGWIPNPDAFNFTVSTVKSGSQTVQLGVGQQLSMVFAL